MQTGRHAMPTLDSPKNVCVGVIVSAHGIKGQVKVKSFTQDASMLAAYGPLFDEAGLRRFEMTVTGTAKDAVIAAIKGITDRNGAEALKGVKLFVPRGALPELADEEFYYADLIGLVAELSDGTRLGEVIAVHNFGAGDVVEVKRTQGSAIDIPFSRAVVPVVDIARGRIVIEPPEGLIAGPEKPRPGKSAEKSAEPKKSATPKKPAGPKKSGRSHAS